MDEPYIKLDIDGYTLSDYMGDSYFIARPDGEGMQISAEDLKQLLENYLDENF